MSRRCASKILAGTALALVAAIVQPAAAAERDFYIITVHHDGKTNVRGDATHGAEAYPDAPFGSTRGMWTKQPSETGDWAVRAFVFDPAEVTVTEGDDVRLHFVGVHGMSHTIEVEGVAQPVTVTRGREQVVTFKAKRAGIIRFTCKDHPPSMRGQVVVLPKG